MNQSFHESKLLKLNCDKALSLIKWEPTIDFDTTLQLTSDWYYSFYKKNSNAENAVNKLIVLSKK